MADTGAEAEPQPGPSMIVNNTAEQREDSGSEYVLNSSKRGNWKCHGTHSGERLFILQLDFLKWPC